MTDNRMDMSKSIDHPFRVGRTIKLKTLLGNIKRDKYSEAELDQISFVLAGNKLKYNYSLRRFTPIRKSRKVVKQFVYVAVTNTVQVEYTDGMVRVQRYMMNFTTNRPLTASKMAESKWQDKEKQLISDYSIQDIKLIDRNISLTPEGKKSSPVNIKMKQASALSLDGNGQVNRWDSGGGKCVFDYIRY